MSLQIKRIFVQKEKTSRTREECERRLSGLQQTNCVIHLQHTLQSFPKSPYLMFTFANKLATLQDSPEVLCICWCDQVGVVLKSLLRVGMLGAVRSEVPSKLWDHVENILMWRLFCCITYIVAYGSMRESQLSRVMCHLHTSFKVQDDLVCVVFALAWLWKHHQCASYLLVCIWKSGLQWRETR